MAIGPGIDLSITDKRFSKASAPLFSGFTLEIAPSSVVALVGSSGIGKSTLLRMIAGIDTDFSGTITINGIAAARAPTPGFVFQDPRLLPWLTAADNIRAVNQHCTTEQAFAALQRVGLGDAAPLFPHQLSGGMQRRVALARALAVNAQLLLLDEPFVSLNRALVAEMHALFLQLTATSKPTVIFVSHLVEDAVRLADRAVVLAHRPATMVADIVMPVPAEQRDVAIFEQYRSAIENSLNGSAGVPKRRPAR